MEYGNGGLLILNFDPSSILYKLRISLMMMIIIIMMMMATGLFGCTYLLIAFTPSILCRNPQQGTPYIAPHPGIFWPHWSMDCEAGWFCTWQRGPRLLSEHQLATGTWAKKHGWISSW
jgi:hypothetical protein